MPIPPGLALAVGLAAGALSQTPASAQTSPRPCVNESVAIDIRAQSMEAALRAFSRQTHCPVSGTADSRGLTANAVRGDFTPSAALAALVENQGMTARSLRQGFSVARTAQAGPAAPRYNCQNESIAIRIGAMPLPQALDALSEATRCPISIAFEVNGLTSRAVDGVFTPSEALAAMLVGTGLQGRTIRQGLTVTPGPR